MKSKQAKKREVIFTIVATDSDTEETLGEGDIAVVFTGKISTGLCISAMCDGLDEAIRQNGEFGNAKLIDGKFHDIILCR